MFSDPASLPYVRPRHLLVATTLDVLGMMSMPGFNRLKCQGWEVTIAQSSQHAWRNLDNGWVPSIALVRICLPPHLTGPMALTEPAADQSVGLVRQLVHRRIIAVPWIPEVATSRQWSTAATSQMERCAGQTAFGSLPGACMFEMLYATLSAPAMANPTAPWNPL